MRKMRRSGIGVRTVAMAFGVSVRTVQREMKRRRALLKIASSLRVGRTFRACLKSQPYVV